MCVCVCVCVFVLYSLYSSSIQADISSLSTFVVLLVIILVMTYRHLHMVPHHSSCFWSLISCLSLIVSTPGSHQTDNASKTQFISFGTLQQLQKLDVALLPEKFPLFSFLSTAQDLGFTLVYSSLTFTKHIFNLTRSSYFHIRRLGVIRRSVSSSVSSLL